MKKYLLIYFLFFYAVNTFSKDVYLKTAYNAGNDNKICLKAEYDVKTYHGKNDLYFIFGFFTGPVAVVYSFFKQQDISEKTIILSKNKDLLNNPVYVDCYKKAAEKMLFYSTLLGWLFSSISLFILTMIYKYLL